MAIGVRISSINLSGDTADVTFLPTSGGSINLGSQTIPFNYISPNYQGTYQLYVPQFGYTYDIVVGASTVTGQTYAWLSTLTNNFNWGTSVTSFIDMTAQVIDMDVDGSGWYENNWYPITEQGYGIQFYNRDNSDYMKVRFLDTVGNLVEEYNTYSTNYSFNYLSGKIIYLNDRANGILKYYDGYQVYTFTSDTNNQQVNVLNDYNGVTSSNTFGISVRDTNTNDYTNYIVSGTNLTQYSTYNSNTYNQQSIYYFDGSFIGELNYLQSGSDMQNLKFYDGVNGNVLQTYDFTTGATYNNWNIYPYGNNKIVIYFWNYADINVDWLFIQYDGNTNTLRTLFHPRGTNYQSISFQTNNNYHPNNGPSEAWVANIYNANTNTNFGSVVNYCDIIYMLEGDTSIQTYVYQNSGNYDKIMNTYWVTGNNAVSYGSNGDGYASIFVLNQSGFTSSATTVSSGATAYADVSAVGDKFVFHTYEDTYSASTIASINSVGVISDIISHIPRPSGDSWSNYGGVYFYSNYISASYFIDGTSDLFQVLPINPFSNPYNYYSENTYFTPDFLRPSKVLFFDYNAYQVTTLSLTGITSTFSLPDGGNGYNIRMGKDHYLYSYYDGTWIMNLYDYNHNLVNSHDSGYSNSNNTNAIKDRFIQSFNYSGDYIIVGINPTGSTQSTVTNFQSYNGANDAIDWC